MSKIRNFIIFVIVTLTPSFCFAQANIQRATQEVNRPVLEELKKKLQPGPNKISPKPKKKQKMASGGMHFFVKKIRLIGVESFPEKDFWPLLVPYENREITFADLNNLVKDIESEYLVKGVIAAVIIPPQTMLDYVITLEVVESKMGELKIPEHKYFDKRRIAYYWSIHKGEVVSYKKMLMSLELLNQNPDRQVKATLHAGRAPRTTDVDLSVKTKFPAHLFYSADNEGIISTGKDRYGLGGRHNNFLGLDDTLISGSIFGKHFSSLYIYHSIPITKFGTSVLYGYNYSRSIPKKEFAPLGLYSNAATSSVSVKQLLFKDGKQRGEVNVGLDAEDKNTREDTGDINRDRLRVVRMGGIWSQEGIDNNTTFIPKVSQGINSFGALSRNPLSTRNARDVFTKFNFDIVHRKAFSHDIEATLQMKTQIASSRLYPQEEMDLGGIDSVRGYPSGDFLADNAVQLNSELLMPLPILPQSLIMPFTGKSLRQQIKWVAFMDYAWGEKRNALDGEQKHDNLFGIGVGLRIRLTDHLLLRLEWGFPLGERTVTEYSHSHFHFAVSFDG